MPFADSYRNKRVFVTGHTGFKGAWLCEWLGLLGAEVTGFALPPAMPAMFSQVGLVNRMVHIEGDVRDLAVLKRAIETAAPDYVFHLAAQPLVRRSYEDPVETYTTNVMGTVNVLEAVRCLARPCVVVAITTDKCYENREWLHGYREEDPLGGHDPYSSSKGAAELVISAYRRSYFSRSGSGILLASARAGNVVGGGDWSTDRIMPDCIRALQQSQAIPVRNPRATRPWQHVLEPLSGYLQLGAALANAGTKHSASARGELAAAFNFGPAIDSNHTVGELVEEVLRHWPGKSCDMSDPNAVHEATRLNLSTDKAFHLLRWRQVWGFCPTIEKTISWYRAVSAGQSAAEVTRAQIASYTTEAKSANIHWSL